MYDEKAIRFAVRNLGIEEFISWALGKDIQPNELESLISVGIYDRENHVVNHAIVIDYALCG